MMIRPLSDEIDGDDMGKWLYQKKGGGGKNFACSDSDVMKCHNICTSHSHLIDLHSHTLGCIVAFVLAFDDYVGGGDSAMTGRQYKCIHIPCVLLSIPILFTQLFVTSSGP